MRILMHNALTLPNDEHGIKFASEWCERRKNQNILYKRKETTTTIHIEEWYEFEVSE